MLKAPLSAWSAALIATLVGFGGTIALIVQAMTVLGAAPAQVISAVTALCLGIGMTGALLSVWQKMPVVLAWSTPGAALLAASTPGMSWPVAVGVFAAAAGMMVLVGLIPALGRLATRIPAAVASAMLGGVLLPYCLGLFRAMQSDWMLVVLLLAVFLIGRQRFPRYAMLAVLLAGVALVIARGDVTHLPAGPMFGALVWTLPQWDAAALVSIAVPLFLVTLVSQNLPGLVVLKTAGYDAPPRAMLLSTGFASAVLAPFGAHAVNLAAITAAICTNQEALPDKAQRWRVGVIYALFYLALAATAPLLVRLFLAMPPSAIAALTGIALIAPLIGAMESMFADAGDREAAILTFTATASGLSLFGIGAAFWGLLIGFAALAAKRIFAPKSPANDG